ncbi:MAG TPA: PRC-barrel domain-containing protein, partial [Bacillales bacterium]
YKINAEDDELGKAEAFLFDDENWTIRYLVVDTRKWLPGRKVLISPISVKSVNHEEEQVSVRLTKEQVKESPDIDHEKPVSREQELRLNQFYGWGNYWNGPGIWGPAMYPPHLVEGNFVQPSLETEKDSQESHLRSTSEVQNYEILAKDGGIGHVESFLIDDETWKIRYMIIDTKDRVSGRKVLVAPAWVTDIRWSEQRIYVSFKREKVEKAPAYEPDAPISKAYEEKLYNAYGVPPYGDE